MAQDNLNIDLLFELANKLIEYKSLEFLSYVIEDLNTYNSNGKQKMVDLKVLPQIENIAELAIIQAKLNNSLVDYERTNLAFDLKRICNSKIKEDNESFTPIVYVRVKPKKPRFMCYGKKCLEIAKTHVVDLKVFLSVCKDHYFCMECVRSHVIESMYKFGLNGIYCEVCFNSLNVTLSKPLTRILYEDASQHKQVVLIGSDGVSKLRQIEPIGYDDIVRFLNKKDLRDFYKFKENLKNLHKCSMHNCSRKGKLLNSSFLRDFECCGKICEICFAKSTCNFILSYEDFELSKDLTGLIGIPCPNGHQRVAKIYSVEEIRKLLSRLKNIQNLEKLIKIYEQLSQLFRLKTEYLCENCGMVRLPNSYKSYCQRCKICFFCRRFLHDKSDCEKIEDMKNWSKRKDVELQELNKNSLNEEDLNFYTKIIKMLTIDLKINCLMKITGRKKYEHFHKQLPNFYQNVDSYLFQSSWFETLEEAKIFAGRGAKSKFAEINENKIKFIEISESQYKLRKNNKEISKNEKKIKSAEDKGNQNNLQKFYEINLGNEFLKKKGFYIFYECFTQDIISKFDHYSEQYKYKLITTQDRVMVFSNKYMIAPLYIVEVTDEFDRVPSN